MKWQAGVSNSKINIWLNGISLDCFKLCISPNVAKSITNLISQLGGNSPLAVCLSRKNGTLYRLPRYSQTSERLNKQTVEQWQQYTHVLLVYCCIHLVVGKVNNVNIKIIVCEQCAFWQIWRY